MKIIVCGAGEVGACIARQLAYEGNNVTVIDSSTSKIQAINETLDVSAIVGYPSHPPVLENAGAHDADMIIAVTNEDEINMVTCQVAHSIFDVPIKVARVRHKNYLMPIYKDLYRQEHLPIDYIISPEYEVAQAIINRLRVPGAMDSIPMAGERVKAIELRIKEDSPLIKQPLGRIEELCAHLHMSILGIIREQSLVHYDAREKLMPNDELYFIADSIHVAEVMELFGYTESQARRVILIGGGNIGLFIAEDLEDSDTNFNTKVIELDRERAEDLAGQLEKTTILQGSSLDNQLLSEAGADSADVVISVTNDDEVNILSSMLTKRFGAAHSIALVNKSGAYAPLIASLGIDVIVNPRETTISSILQYTRKGKVRSAHAVGLGVAEIIEMEVQEDSKIVGKSLAEMDMPKGTRVGTIIRGDQLIIPQQRTTIKAGDLIIYLAATASIQRVEKIFSERHDFI